MKTPQDIEYDLRCGDNLHTTKMQRVKGCMFHPSVELRFGFASSTFIVEAYMPGGDTQDLKFTKTGRKQWHNFDTFTEAYRVYNRLAKKINKI